MNQDTGKYIIIIGAIIIVTGIVIYFFHDGLKWFGRLPGDIRIERKNFKFYFPIVTMIILSVVITLIINIIKKFCNLNMVLKPTIPSNAGPFITFR